MLSLLFIILMADTISLPHPDTVAVEKVSRVDTLACDSVPSDTLREVVVRAGKTQLEKNIDRSIDAHRKRTPRVKSLGDVLEKALPGINDKITHPFAFKQRKMERRRKRTKKILEHFDRVKTFDELLRESIREQDAKENKAKGK